MSLKKQYLKSRPICKVTFRLSKEAAKGSKTVFLVGDFNAWDHTANPMQRLKNGDFKLVLELSPKREYQYRYLLDTQAWVNDWNADKYIYCTFGNCDNSVVAL
ncbi:MAG: isoamylase early set domain-containing protein [Desulfobacterales bacterium]